MDAKMLEGKTAIITGASYGMGQTMAELFAEEGANVVLTARGQDKLDEAVERIRAKGGNAVDVIADVCSTEDTRKVMDTALREFGDLDILINNAGIGEQKMIDETEDDWMRYVMDTNLRCNAVAPGATVTPAHLANKAGEQPGGEKMLEYSGHYVYFPGPECDPMDQAYACLYLASKMGRAVRGQVLQVCNGAFL